MGLETPLSYESDFVSRPHFAEQISPLSSRTQPASLPDVYADVGSATSKLVPNPQHIATPDYVIELRVQRHRPRATEGRRCRRRGTVEGVRDCCLRRLYGLLTGRV